jgi:hypothetical protein
MPKYWTRSEVEKRVRTGRPDALREVPSDVQAGFLNDKKKGSVDSEHRDLIRGHFKNFDSDVIRRALNQPDPTGWPPRKE